jgi:hypothetical protein
MISYVAVVVRVVLVVTRTHLRPIGVVPAVVYLHKSENKPEIEAVVPIVELAKRRAQ